MERGQNRVKKNKIEQKFIFVSLNTKMFLLRGNLLQSNKNFQS